MKNLILVTQVIIVCGLSMFAQADTVFQSGDVNSGANWDNGVPNVANGNGIIGTNGTFSGTMNFNEGNAGTLTVTHTNGTLTATAFDWNIHNHYGNADYIWNQTGGIVQVRLLHPNNHVIYTLSGTGRLEGNNGGARILPLNNGVFRQIGGSMWQLSVDVNSGATVALSGGRTMLLGKRMKPTLWAHGSSASVISISGDHTSQIYSGVTAAEVISLTDGASLILDPAWSGRWARGSFTAADWTNALTDVGVKVGATQVTTGNFGTLFTLSNTGTASSAMRLATAPGTYHIAGSITVAASWDNGFPAAGKDGRLVFDGTFGNSLDFSDAAGGTATVSHVYGDFTALSHDWQIRNTAAAGTVFNWIQSGGKVTARVFRPQDRINYTLLGSGQIASTGAGGSRISPTGSGVFTQTGGSAVDMSYEAGNDTTMVLSGGFATQVGLRYRPAVSANLSSSVIQVSGEHTMEFDTVVSAVDVVQLTNGATLVFDPLWTGSWTRDNFTAADWETALTDTGVMVGSKPVTSSNFSSLFIVSDAGVAGSSVQLAPPSFAGTVILLQ